MRNHATLWHSRAWVAIHGAPIHQIDSGRTERCNRREQLRKRRNESVVVKANERKVMGSIRVHLCHRLRPSGCKQRPPSETSTRPRGARVVKREIPGATCMGSLELPYAKFVLCVNRPSFVQDLGHYPKLYVHCFHGKLHGSSARAWNHIRPHPTPPMINVTSSG